MHILKPTLAKILLALLLTVSYTPFIRELVSCPVIPLAISIPGKKSGGSTQSGCTYKYILTLQYLTQGGQDTQFAGADPSNTPQISLLLPIGFAVSYILSCVFLSVFLLKRQKNT